MTRGDENPANVLTKPLSVDNMIEELLILNATVVRRIHL